MLVSYPINWGCNSHGFKKSKQFSQSDIASDIAALTLTLSVNGPLEIDVWALGGYSAVH